MATFSRDSVAAGSLEQLLAKVKKLKAGRRIRTVDRTLFDLKGIEPVDDVFLSFLDAHRKQLAKAIYAQNVAAFPEAETIHGAAKVTEAVQRIMDRLVFMRVLEDRGVTAYGQLRENLDRIGVEGGEFYDSLTATFRELDRRFNGYLFKPHFSDELEVDGSVLADFVRTLYPAEGPWDFKEIGVDILGTVYERFLGDVVTVAGKSVGITRKPAVRHKGGVYYTPRFIVDSIIRRVVGPRLSGRTPAEVLEVRILDPACGSGSFLTAALQYLFDYCLSVVQKDPSLAKAAVPALSADFGTKTRKKKSEIAFQDRQGRWHLAPDFRAALLIHCIHGVDIDQQAVEVTVMSLYVKMLDSELPENWATLWVEKQLLPSLDNNVRCGNSLIDEQSYDAFVSHRHRTLFKEDDDVAFRMNRFDWTSQTRGFGRLLDSTSQRRTGRTGFDCIVGNPPYIRVQELRKWASEESEFYKWKYESAHRGSFDIYMIFVERCLSLLAKGGLLGFIMPHKFWQNRDGFALRRIIAGSNLLVSVVDFGDQQVFKNATTYTAIHALGEKRGDFAVDVARVKELEDGVAQCAAIDAGKPAKGVVRFRATIPTDGTEWRFHDEATQAFFRSLVNVSVPLFPGVCDAVFQGIVTGADDVFLSNDWQATSHESPVMLVSIRN